MPKGQSSGHCFVENEVSPNKMVTHGPVVPKQLAQSIFKSLRQSKENLSTYAGAAMVDSGW